MASGSVKFAISATPIETLTDAESGTHSIAASSAYGTAGGSGTITLAAINATGGATHGYQDGVKYYGSAAVGALADLTIAAAEFIFVKNTGFSGAAGTTLGTTANTTDLLQVAVHDGTNAVSCGFLAAGEGMVVPLKGVSVTAHKVQIRSLNPSLASFADGGATIQVEYMAIA
tara:strand:+ start:41 stop:559 length:519 start_codon:yes stop_codon:yes gene_type:complete